MLLLSSPPPSILSHTCRYEYQRSTPNFQLIRHHSDDWQLGPHLLMNDTMVQKGAILMDATGV